MFPDHVYIPFMVSFVVSIGKQSALVWSVFTFKMSDIKETGATHVNTTTSEHGVSDMRVWEKIGSLRLGRIPRPWPR